MLVSLELKFLANKNKTRDESLVMDSCVCYKGKRIRGVNRSRSDALFRDFRHQMKEDSHLEANPLLFF